MNFIQIILLFALLTFSLPLLAQVEESPLRKRNCRIPLESISVDFWGECKNGMAHGNGIAQGEDRYEGVFKKGLPNGEGKYIWANGDYYIGDFRKGMKDGKGKLIKSTASPEDIAAKPMGLWSNDEFVMDLVEAEYNIILQRNVIRVEPRLIKPEKKFIKVRLREGTFPDNAEINTLSGDVRNLGSYITIEEPIFPYKMYLTFQHFNKFNSSSQQVILDLELVTPGEWDVFINLQ